MLVTNTNWADPDPVMQDLAECCHAWRYVAWTGETLNFWVIPSRDLHDGTNLPDGWMVGGPEALLEGAADLVAGTFSVYVLDHNGADGAVRLCRVTGIWREREQTGGMHGFWYATDAGGLRPCARSAPLPGARLELASELVFDRHIGCGS